MACRPEPLSRDFGKERGKPIDRWYHPRVPVEASRGRALADSGHTDYLGEGAVTSCDVLHVRPTYPWVTIVGDLATGEGIPSAAFDCIVLT